MKKVAVITTALLLFAGALHAQSAGKISTLLKTEAVTYGQAAYFAAVYQSGDESLDEERAFSQQVEQGLLPAKSRADAPISLKELSRLYMQATGMKGGLFYSLFHSPRYAFRELKAQGIIPEKADPSQKVSGRDSLALLNGCIQLAGGAE